MYLKIMKPKKKKKPVEKIDILESIFEAYPDEEFLKADGFDEAIIGVDTKELRLVYSVSKCLEILEKDMTFDEALEYFEYNVSGAYMGEKTPIWVEDYFG